MSVPDFDFVAAFYDPLARLVFGRTLVRAQQAALRHGLPPGAPRVLFIGGGTGRVLPDVLAFQGAAQVTYVEASAEMLRRAQDMFAQIAPGAAAQVTFIHGTEADLPPDAQFDAVAAFFLFDLFTEAELAALLDHLQRHAHAGTRWLVADFAPARRFWQHGLQWLMYRFFRRASGVTGRQLPDIAAALGQLGLQRQWQQHWADGLVEASVWE
ncbi:methyltransferase domain-containing protein [Hymenobacter busanensis]|uniref:Methyltransferase domain-containing protein n=1 Tax=Hymenobacter busanensis TaxID=2607656 RepID=A0A7L4ZW51_9BACT|nr:class I SAM-dependent methyltransferase [Hymenobacter busanensis]KAA9332439.1 methyltransferase domain-containing protein [Hymenobacter busanensis]QHJ07223.1 methyltransferase domain-containing protein [Hymenobacter busanensis]